MTTKDLQIGDQILFQFPLYDPQKGTIVKIYSDSVIVENNLHVSEKYIVKKIEKPKLKNFIFDFYVQSISSSPLRFHSNETIYKMNGIGILNGQEYYIENLPAPDFNLGKIYTIEIKEK